MGRRPRSALRVAASELESKLEQALDRRLDQALEETFRASDPISGICNRASKTVRNVMEYKFERRQKPSIIVSDTDQRRLTILATDALQRFPEVAEELLSEMERADVVTAEAIPPNVVQMGSDVVFESDNGETRRVRLVFPGQADIAAGRISILTPIGAALIGLSEGQSIAWKTRDGRSRQLTILAVEGMVADLRVQA